MSAEGKTLHNSIAEESDERPELQQRTESYTINPLNSDGKKGAGDGTTAGNGMDIDQASEDVDSSPPPPPPPSTAPPPPTPPLERPKEGARSPPDSASPPARPKLKHRNSINLAVSTGHKHGKFKNVEAPKADEDETVFEQKPVTFPQRSFNNSSSGSKSPGKPSRRQSLLRQQSGFQLGKKRVRTGRKLKFVDEVNQGPLEHTSYSERLHYCDNSVASDPMDDPHSVRRPARCCTIS